MRLLASASAILTACAAACPAQEYPAPVWASPSAFRSPAGSQEAADAKSAAVLWEQFKARMAGAEAADPKMAEAAREEGTALAVLVRRGRFAVLPYPAGMADGRSRHLRPAAAGPLTVPGPSPAERAAWLRAAFRDGLDPAYAAARAALGDPAFAKPDGSPRPSALARALEGSDASAAAWNPVAEAVRGPRALAAWAKFRSDGEGSPSIPQVAEAELTAALEWGALRSGKSMASGAARGALARLAVAWMARKRPGVLAGLATLEVASVRGFPAAFRSVAEAAGPANLAELMVAARAEGFPEDGPEHRAAALVLLDESPDGSWGVSAEVRRGLRRAAKASSVVPLVSPEQALAALDGIPGLADPPGSPGRAADEEAVAAAFREPPAAVAAWEIGQEWAKRADNAKRDAEMAENNLDRSRKVLGQADRRLEGAERGLAAAKNANRTMGEALDAFDAWSKETDRARKEESAGKAWEAVARLRDCLDRDGPLLPAELVAKGRDIVALAGAKLKR